MNCRSIVFTVTLGALSSTFAATTDPLQAPAVRAFLQKNCFECHDTETKKGGLALDALPSKLDDPRVFDKWVLAFDRMSAGEMPPAKKPRPDAKQLAATLATLRTTLEAHNAKLQQANGRVILRRLNRVEYENTLRDLLAIDAPLKQLLPEDTPQHGFDTVAEGLHLSQLHMEKYLEAADAAIAAAMQFGPKPTTEKKRFLFKDEKGIRENLDKPEGTIDDPVAKSKHHIIFKELPDGVVFFSDGYSPTDLRQFNPQFTGLYRIRISANAYQSHGRNVAVRLYSHRYQGRTMLAFFDMPPDKPRVAEAVVRLEDGQVVNIAPFDTGYDDNGKDIWAITGPEYGGVGLAVQWVEIEGPLVTTWPPPSVQALFGDTPVRELDKNHRPWKDGKQRVYELVPSDPRAAVRPLVERFATRAFRRPLDAGEADGFVKLATDAIDAKQSFEDAMRLAFRAVLTAPQFLLFDERPGKLDDYALASRLSYFLWSSMPDDALLQLAATKMLAKTGVLHEQVERVLNSPKAAAFTSNFVGQWLDLRSIDATTPDMRLYPDYDELLRVSMVAETEAFFTEVLKNNLSIANFIASDFVMLNRRMAELYGIPGVNGEQFQRVAVPVGNPRGGMLTQASVLKVTANGTVTSPVRRGAWVLKRMLGQPPRPPPADVGAIEPDTRGATTIREQLDKHRHVESCAVCHRVMDPPGFALENFDVIGGWRDRYRSTDKGDRPTQKFRGRDIGDYKLGPRVDASGELPDGKKFADIAEFKKLLLAQQEQIARSLTGKLLTYATGAGIQFADRAAVEEILKRAKLQKYGLRSLVHDVVTSEPFLTK